MDWHRVERGWEEYLKDAGEEHWREAFVPVIEGVIVDQGEQWNADLGMRFDVHNLFAEEWFSDYMLGFPEHILETTRGDMALLLQQGMKEGWSINETMDQLDLVFKGWIDGDLSEEEREQLKVRTPAYRREMIARTETLKASNAGSMELFRGWGMPMKEWLATFDPPRARAEHMDAGRRYTEGGDPGPIGIDEYFVVGGERMLYPHDPNASAGNVINCRCSVAPYDPAWANL